jgi:RNA polymerase sigma-70 factor (ECF subfamily)
VSKERQIVQSQLLQKIATGDRAAFAELFDFYAPRLKTFMMRSGLNEPHAEEMAQEVMASIWRASGQFDAEKAAASTWIYAIAKNQRFNYLRRIVKRGKIDEALKFQSATIEPDTEQYRPDKVLAVHDRDKQVRLAITQLPEDQRIVLRQSYFSDHAHGEIAKELDIPLGTVKSRLRLAMNKLRKILDEQNI